MLKFVTKTDCWGAEDAGLPALLPPVSFPWHLKSIQDTVAMSFLQGCRDEKIAEIGGGHSRLLPFLSRKNQTVNVDRFEGQGGGPTKPDATTKVIPAFMGDFDTRLHDGEFDTVFSISVVEHVPLSKLPDFHTDCLRILKPGGLLLHLIDTYLCDDAKDNAAAIERIRAYKKWLREPSCEPLDPVQILRPKEVRFSCSFATNPDNEMQRWNRVAPSLRDLRSKAQSVSLLFGARKHPA
jgi:SAM-dependent methyltransferase